MNRARVVASFVAARWHGRRRRRNRAALERWQQRQVGKHLNFLRDNSPYFADLLGFGPAQLTDLPPMDKSVMMANFNRLNTAGLDRNRALEIALTAERDRDFTPDYHGFGVGLSSGTTGHRGLFITSPREQAQWAGTVLAKTLPRQLFGHRIALFLRANNALYERVGSRAVSFQYFDIYADSAQNTAKLLKYQPTILVAPPSVLREIAGQTAAAQEFAGLQKIYSVAEVLDRSDEAFLKEAFGAQVIHQIYQCTEGLLGSTCPAGTLHLHEDIALFEREWLDERRFVPVITDFRRRTQPIVRYRLNDVLVTRAQPCPCGSAMIALERIEGREDDTLYFSAPDGAPVRVFADMITRVLVHAEGISQYRVVQTEPAKLLVELEYAPGKDEAQVQGSVKSELERLAAGQGFMLPQLEFGHFRHDFGRKLRRVERRMKDITGA